MKTRSQTIKCADVERAEALSEAKNAGCKRSEKRVESVDDKQRIMELIVTEINHSLTPTEIPSLQIYEVNIDFDDASAAWRMNKKSTGGGCYKYICEAKTQLGNNCLREPMIGCAYCKTHNKSNPSTSIYGSLQKK
jgi:hypothetical protein